MELIFTQAMVAVHPGDVKQVAEKLAETSNSVIPAKAGIQNVEETVDFKSWTPAFAGVTTTFPVDLNHLRFVGAGRRG